MNELALFAGAGGGILGGYLLGWRTVCAVEIEDYPRQVLLERQRDGILPRFPIWDDITTFDGRPWKGRVNIITGGFPCQDISIAGKGAGITGEKSGLWKEMSRVVREVQPRFVLVENSPALIIRGLGVVLGDLAQMGYDARWCVLGADDAGAPHQRKRAWILAYLGGSGCKTSQPTIAQKPKNSMPELSNIEWWDIDPADLSDVNEFYDDMEGYGTSEVPESEKTEVPGCEIPDINSKRLERERTKQQTTGTARDSEKNKKSENWPVESRVVQVVHGVSHRVQRIKALGNAQVPSVAALAFIILSEGLDF